MRRYATGLAIVIALATMACSRTPQEMNALPTAPTAATAPTNATLLFGNIGSVRGERDASFPARNTLFTFFLAADAKYQGMGRAASAFYIDREGVAVWMQEYIRYRVNGCDHTVAVQRVVTQIGGGAAGGVCGSPSDGVIAFPSRADSLAALREFDATYQRQGRGQTQMFIDLEGAAIWIQEFLRYMLNSCDAATAQIKVFAQIDGGPVAPTCFVECNYTISGRSDIGSGATTGSFEIRPTDAFSDPRSCGWTLSSDSSWLTINNGVTEGSGFQVINFTVARNDGSSRRGIMTLRWGTNGSATYIVNQDGTPFQISVTMNDSFRGANPATECFIKSSNTPCTFTAGTNLPGGGYSYAWSAQWFYGVQKSSTTTSSSNTFTVTEQCGGTGSGTEGPATGLNVQLTITDDRNNVVSYSGSYALRLFTCS